MAEERFPGLVAALQDFRRARRQANLQEIIARLTGRPVELLSYEEVRQKLRATESGRQQLREIPLDHIVGSVGRYTDFTRSFLPRRDSAAERWARVKAKMTDLAGLPPIEVYQIGEAYFVRDGNHRVSVARQLGATHIQAYVTEVHSQVPLPADVQPDDLILKAEQAAFLEQTRLNVLRPQTDISVTEPGQYQALLEHIQVHRHFMGIEQGREIPYEEAVAHWHDEVYLPVVEIIREQGILRDFPGRTETDLYLWIARHRAEVEEELGWVVEATAAARDLAARFGEAERVVAWLGKALAILIPDGLEGGPPAGEWRQAHLAGRQDERLFAEVLVPVSGEERGWYALTCAIDIARREGARLHGLHVVPDEEALEGEAAQAIRAEFDRRCREAGVPGSLALDSGNVARRICARAHLSDLIVLGLAHPPAPQPLARLGSGLRTVVRRCPVPVLAVPRPPAPFERALLAYDGNPRAEEALFVATYLAGRWGLALTVVSVTEGDRPAAEPLARARLYLQEHGVQAAFVEKSEPTAEAILQAADECDASLIVLGSYGLSPLIEAVAGSTLDHLLRASQRPLLICR